MPNFQLTLLYPEFLQEILIFMIVSQVFEIFLDCLSMRHRIMKRSGTLELLTFSIFAESQTKEFLYGDFIEKKVCFT